MKTFQREYEFIGSIPGIEDDIIALRKAGKTYLAITAIIGVSSKRISSAVRKYRLSQKT
ncbi:hypothetical protein AAF463_24035 (plasmid) [Pantoea sp. BJ2]|uniref:Uncharacterized protein n=1 Tax=Pantoea sp. BJ2 TaxID=3141322 RepID=A0AAU7U507_9GAMM